LRFSALAEYADFEPIRVALFGMAAMLELHDYAEFDASFRVNPTFCALYMESSDDSVNLLSQFCQRAAGWLRCGTIRVDQATG